MFKRLYFYLSLLILFLAALQPTLAKAQTIQLQYLGVGGYLIEYDSHKILFAPSFSNPGYSELAQSIFSGELKANKQAIDKLYPVNGRDKNSQTANNVSAILVGHAHYDHLLDVPHIMRTYTKNAKVYGSKTMQSILLTKGIKPERIVTLNQQVNDNSQYDNSKWQYISDHRIRFMAIKADHAPHVGQIMFADGHYDGNRLDKKLDVNDWRLGETYAFVVDFLDKQQNIKFRLHYADAASSAPNGFLPKSMLKEKAIDLAILCLAGFSKVDGYPQDIVNHLKPKHVLVGHWEDFFGNRGQPPSPVVGSDQEKFLKQLKAALPQDADWTMPDPMVTLNF